jgi:hypothetical protein
MPRMHVNAAALNIRSSADMNSNNVVATLPFGHPLETTGEHDLKRWIPVEAQLNGKVHKGFVNVGYLRKPLSAEKEKLLADAAQAWTSKSAGFPMPTDHSKFAHDDPKVAKPAIGDFLRSSGADLVVARGLTQVWAFSTDMKIVKYPLLEDGRLDDKAGKVAAVYRNLT